VQLSEEAERKLPDERMKEWSKDQEEYTERQHQEIQRKRGEKSSFLKPREQEKVDRRKKEQEERARREAEIEENLVRIRRKEARAEAREKEAFEAKEAITVTYRERFTKTLDELREIEREQAEIKRRRRTEAIPWYEGNKLIARDRELREAEGKILGERESLNSMMDEEIGARIQILKRRWEREDEE
jgi:hypothetical protein